MTPDEDSAVHSLWLKSTRFTYFQGRSFGIGRTWCCFNFEFGGEHIDVLGLVLEADHNLKTFTCTNPFQQLQFVKVRCMLGLAKEVPPFTSTQLQELNMLVNMVSLPKAVTLPPASASLTVLCLSRWYSSSQHHDLYFGAFPNLKGILIESMLYFHFHYELSTSGLRELTKLKKLVLRRLLIVGSLLGLEELTKLNELNVACCWQLTSLPGLGSFRNLTFLSVSTTDVRELPGLEKLLKLQLLHCIGCWSLRSLLDLCALPELLTFNAQMSTLLENVSLPECCVALQPNVPIGVSLLDFAKACGIWNGFCGAD